MRKTYEMFFSAPDAEMVEWAVKELDRYYRGWYNLPGGKRINSGRREGEYYIVMQYTPPWYDNKPNILPTWDGLKRSYFRRLCKFDPDEMIGIVTTSVLWLD